MKFRKKPVVIEAINWDGSSPTLSSIVILGARTVSRILETNQLMIETLEGNMKANLGDWIIKGVNGEIYPCKPDIFEKTYEPVE